MKKRTPLEAKKSLIKHYREFASVQHSIAQDTAARADKYEKEIVGHECGHLFTITVSSVMHSGIVGVLGEGNTSHRDAKSDVKIETEVQVRAHDLPAALHKAAALPLSDWFKEDQ